MTDRLSGVCHSPNHAVLVRDNRRGREILLRWNCRHDVTESSVHEQTHVN